MSSQISKIQQLTSALTAAVSTNHKHGLVRCVSLFFKDDKTGAELDAQSFCAAVTRHFGAIATKCVMTDRPGQEFMNYMNDKFGDKRSDSFGRNNKQDLLILHYSGHGRLINGPSLSLLSGLSGGKSVRYSLISESLTDYQESRANLDVLVVLDSCHAGAGQFRSITDQSHEVIYAVAASQTMAAQGSSLSFTQKLITAINDHWAMKPTRSFVDPIELVTHIQRTSSTSAAMPGHNITFGGKRLSLHFKPLPLTALSHADPYGPSEMPRPVAAVPAAEPESPPTATAILSIELPADPDDPQSQAILSSLRSLANEVTAIEIISVERVRSTLVLLRGSVTWALRVARVARALVKVLGITDHLEIVRSAVAKREDPEPAAAADPDTSLDVSPYDSSSPVRPLARSRMIPQRRI